MLNVVRTEYTNKPTELIYPNNNVFQCKWINVGFIESFYSLIWTDRYNEAGEFELKIAATKENINILHEDYYLLYSMSEHAMVIEKIELITNAESGDYLLVSGRSLESILDRRIVYTRTKFLGRDISRGTKTDISQDPSMVRNVIYSLIRDAFGESGALAPSNRTVFEFGYFLMGGGLPSNQMAKILPTQEELAAADNHPFMSMFVTAEMYSDTLYTIITQLCQEFGIGYRIELTPVNDITIPGTGTQFVVRLYYGLNLTEDLNANQSGKVVIFSPNFNNLISSEYSLDKRDYKNFVKIDGVYHETVDDQQVEEDISTSVEGKVRTSSNELLPPTGLTRYETYLDASSISDKISADITLTYTGSYASAPSISNEDLALSFINYSSIAHFSYDSDSQIWLYSETGIHYTTADLNQHGFNIPALIIGDATITMSVDYNGATERTIDRTAFEKRLKNEGNGTLIEKSFLEDFSADVAFDIGYKYGEDYSLGDIVSFVNRYGVFMHCRVTEVIISEDENGFNMQPSFEPVSSNLNQVEES